MSRAEAERTRADAAEAIATELRARQEALEAKAVTMERAAWPLWRRMRAALVGR
jgi:hypothetical protein